MMFVGVGEIQLALRMYKQGRNIRNGIKLILGIADLASSGMDFYCNNQKCPDYDCQEICQEWKEVSLYVQLGLLSTTALENLLSSSRVRNWISGRKAVEGVGKSKIISKLEALGDLKHAKYFVNSLDDAVDAKLLSRIENLTNLQLKKLDELYDPKVFQRPGNRPVRNGKKADGDFTVKTRDGKHEIYFDKYGFADLKRFTLGDEFTYSGNLAGNSKDFSEATKWLKNKFKDSPDIKIKRNNTNLDVSINGKKKTYTWHHHQNGKVLELVETSVHKEIAHTGGSAIIIRYLQGLFE